MGQKWYPAFGQGSGKFDWAFCTPSWATSGCEKLQDPTPKVGRCSQTFHHHKPFMEAGMWEVWLVYPRGCQAGFRLWEGAVPCSRRGKVQSEVPGDLLDLARDPWACTDAGTASVGIHVYGSYFWPGLFFNTYSWLGKQEHTTISLSDYSLVNCPSWESIYTAIQLNCSPSWWSEESKKQYKIKVHGQGPVTATEEKSLS